MMSSGHVADAGPSVNLNVTSASNIPASGATSVIGPKSRAPAPVVESPTRILPVLAASPPA